MCVCIVPPRSQITKESASFPAVTKAATTPSVSSTPPIQATVMAPVSEVCTTLPSKSAQSSLINTSFSSVSVSSSPSPSPTPVPPSHPVSPPTQQLFTVHGHFMGPGDHCGSAPNVTVNPAIFHHGTTGEHGPTPPPRPVAPPPAADQQIRVLTPSEIMRTLPSLGQENYEPQSLVRNSETSTLSL